MVSAQTERLYATAQADFLEWCRNRRIRNHPVSSEIVAQYLEFCLQNNGPTAVPLRSSAIGKLYRDQGNPFDTKAPPIQNVLRQARAQLALRKRPGTK